MEKKFYGEHIQARIVVAQVVPCMHTFQGEHILGIPHSMEDTFYKQHILARIAVAQVVPGMYNLAVLEQHF